jgi:cation/acetate symporter
METGIPHKAGLLMTGFLACWLGTVLSRERGAERSYNELRVRAETGIGSA